MFGPTASRRSTKSTDFSWTRDLEGVGNENTQFRVTYQHHIGGTKWGDDIRAVTSMFKACDNESRTVTLTA